MVLPAYKPWNNNNNIVWDVLLENTLSQKVGGIRKKFFAIRKIALDSQE